MSTLFSIKKARMYNRTKIASSVSGGGKSRQLHVENEIRALPNTIHKYKLKVD